MRAWSISATAGPVAFKIESHNHPSAIEPFQGAATGVGGIIRDIFTMGARPEFCLNSLRFGPITENCRGDRVGATPGIQSRIDKTRSQRTGDSSPASSPASRITATASAFPPSAARFISTKASRAIRW